MSTNKHKNWQDCQKQGIIKIPVLPFDNNSIDLGSVPEILTLADVAQLLKVSLTSVRRLQQGRHIPFIKVGGSVRFQKRDLLSYLEKQRVESIEQ
jgi:excisionase family DNA binding protein